MTSNNHKEWLIFHITTENDRLSENKAKYLHINRSKAGSCIMYNLKADLVTSNTVSM